MTSVSISLNDTANFFECVNMFIQERKYVM